MGLGVEGGSTTALPSLSLSAGANTEEGAADGEAAGFAAGPDEAAGPAVLFVVVVDDDDCAVAAEAPAVAPPETCREGALEPDRGVISPASRLLLAVGIPAKDDCEFIFFSMFVCDGWCCSTRGSAAVPVPFCEPAEGFLDAWY